MKNNKLKKNSPNKDKIKIPSISKGNEYKD